MTLVALVLLAAASLDSTPVFFYGMCDASGAVPLEDGRFAVADDEDNVLRIYDSGRGGAALGAVDVSAALELPMKKKGPAEADLEAATRLGDQALWLASHGRNSKGKRDTGRLRFFATSTPSPGGTFMPVGRPYKHLLDDLLSAPALRELGLAIAEQRAPKAQGGLNIEGMTARPDGKSVLLGFRSPLVDGRAIALPLENPLGLLRGERARFGAAQLLDLGGLGVRSLSWWHGKYLVIAGAVDREASARIFRWDGKGATATAVPDLDLSGLNPEGVVSFEDRDRVLLLSDDGELATIGGEPCKRLADASRKRFRGHWLRLE
jgi:hypothetical protein